MAGIIELVNEKALGVFIWVRLVVDIIVKGIRDGTPLSSLELQAREMPQELEDLYTHTIRRVEPSYITETHIVLQIVLCSLAPLPVGRVFALTTYNYRCLNDEGAVWTSRFAPLSSLASQARWLESRGGGLLEVVPNQATSKSGDEEQGNIVQFIHQTVKDFVQTSHYILQLPNIVPQARDEDGNMFMLRAYEKSNKGWVPPAGDEVFAYAKRAEKVHAATYPGTLESSELISSKRSRVLGSLQNIAWGGDQFNLGWWLRNQEGHFYTALREELDFMKKSNVQAVDDTVTISKEGDEKEVTEDRPHKLLVILAVAANLTNAVSVWANSPRNESFRSWGLLHIAAAGPDIATNHDKVDPCQMVKTILASGHPVDSMVYQNWFFFACLPKHDLANANEVTPLALLLLSYEVNSGRDESTQLAIAKILLDSGADATRTLKFGIMSNSPIVTLLQYSVCHLPASFVRLLLQHDARSHSKLEEMILRCMAHLRKDHGIIQALNDHGIMQDNEDERGYERMYIPKFLIPASLSLAMTP